MITPKVRKPELSILYVTCHLVLIYISTKNHQNIPKGIQVTEQTRFCANADANGIRPENNMSPHFGRGGGDIIRDRPFDFLGGRGEGGGFWSHSFYFLLS